MQSIARRRLALWLDRRSVRIVLALIAGLPAGVFVVVYGFLGLSVALGGLSGGTPHPIFMGLMAVTSLGVLGVAGAWLRLLQRHSSMTGQARRLTVALMLCGVASALCLAVYIAMEEGKLRGAAMWFLVALVGMLFIAATPAASAETHQEGLQHLP
jgi:hypothetical protein